ncbi:HAD-IA family hydrolase [Nitrincola sp.]|uniref:HAD-IA family hydrolase n=1 Tax=Nitrincola sp. TaxID=1926584 RepID=UPI003A92F9C7
MNHYEMIIFDLDGTLLDTVEEVAYAMNDALQESELPVITLSQARDWVGKGAPHFLTQVLEHHQLTDQVSFESLLNLFYKHYERRSGTLSKLYPSVRETLEILSKSKRKLCIVSNKFKRGTDKVLKAHQLDHLFDDIFGGDSFEQKKPDPVAVHFLMQKYTLLPDQVLFIGDSSTDVATARNAGVTVWTVPYGYNHGEAIQKSMPDRMIEDFSELQARLSA